MPLNKQALQTLLKLREEAVSRFPMLLKQDTRIAEATQLTSRSEQRRVTNNVST
ncbi:hypothetical protein Deide_3p02812 (plasmid) [Deinococcus deserti VCD115]|uniref:Uncharacterized protein n=1 Tax=Deinococcus deserti (strain DSM 17065 / CIP 109153 / LMG 22923 / VCD115) TaxID=546414 RepID=X5H5Y9_DEIDV|nr:hypothetical protein Deide_3p02812 [Deinococcus deserti VCD115]